MANLVEPATTGRAKCRGCGERIEVSVLRFGEGVPNPYGEGDTTHWFHLECAAFKRPQPFLETLESAAQPVPDGERLVAEARRGTLNARLQRVGGGERDPSGRAQCRQCRSAIPKGAWRIPLVIYEEDRFSPAGFVHASCARAYFGTADVLGRVKRFSPALSEADAAAIGAEVEAGSGTPGGGGAAG
jgi:hypothetical protein